MKKPILKLLNDEQIENLLDVMTSARKELLRQGFSLSELVSDDDFNSLCEMSAKLFKEIRCRNLKNKELEQWKMSSSEIIDKLKESNKDLDTMIWCFSADSHRNDTINQIVSNYNGLGKEIDENIKTLSEKYGNMKICEFYKMYLI